MMVVLLGLSIILSTAAVLVSPAVLGTNVNYCKLKCPCENSMRYTVHLPSEYKNKFYVCNYGVGILMPCGAGTEFNPKIQVCDWPASAQALACEKNHQDYIKCKPGDEFSGDGSD